MSSSLWNVLTHPVSIITTGITAVASEVAAVLGPKFSLKDTKSFATCCADLTTQIAAQFCGNTTASSTTRDDFCADILSRGYLWWLGKAGIVLVPILTVGSMRGAAFRISKISLEAEPLVDHGTKRSPITHKCIKVLTSKTFIICSALLLLLSGAGAWTCSDFANHYTREIGKNCIEGATLDLLDWPHTLTNTSIADRLSYCVIQAKDLKAFSISYYVAMGLLPASSLGLGSSFIAQAMSEKRRESASRVNVDNAGAATDT